MLMALFSQLIINFYSGFEANFDKKVMQLSDYEEPISVYNDNVTENLQGVFDQYGKLVRENSVEVMQYDNISDSLLKVGENDLLDYRKNYVIGGDFKPLLPRDILSFLPPSIDIPFNISILTGLYNSIPKHSRPLSMNYISNALLRHIDGNENRTITVSNHPLPFTFTVRLNKNDITYF